MTDAVAAPPLDIPTLAALLAGAAIVVGVDTGLTHLAAALGRPMVALFAGSEPGADRRAGRPRPAINLGGKGRPPSAQAMSSAALQMLG